MKCDVHHFYQWTLQPIVFLTYVTYFNIYCKLLQMYELQLVQFKLPLNVGGIYELRLSVCIYL